MEDPNEGCVGRIRYTVGKTATYLRDNNTLLYHTHKQGGGLKQKGHKRREVNTKKTDKESRSL